MKIATIDLETFWSSDHSLSKMNPIVYCTHPETEIISMSVKCDNYPTDVFFGEAECKRAVKGMRGFADYMVIGHNLSGFDAMILSWRLGVAPRMWGCTMAMARPIYAKSPGLSLDKLTRHLGLGVKDNTALMNTKGRKLADFTDEEREAMRVYNREDSELCYKLFQALLPHYTPKELWHIDATIRMLVDQGFECDVDLLKTTLDKERKSKKRSVLQLAKVLLDNDMATPEMRAAQSLDELQEALRSELASAPKFSALLAALGVETPTKPSPTDPDNKTVPALAKTDEGFLALLEHDDEVVAAAARARLEVKSTILESRIEAFLEAAGARGGMLPIPAHYCGADTTGRWSGWGYNPQNLPRVNPSKPKLSDALRNSIQAPKGHAVVVSDLSGIELRVNHFLWKVPSTMALYQNDPQADLYRASGAAAYQCKPEDVTKDQRQIEKIKNLGLGFGAGAATFRKVAKLMGGLDITEAQSDSWVRQWREQYSPIVEGWRTCHEALTAVFNGDETPVDPWGLCTTTKGAIVLPSGRAIRYPGLRQETSDSGKKEWIYGEGRHKARIYAGKVTENIVQALARDVLADNAVEFFKATGLRYKLTVHDELVYIVPEGEAEGLLAILQKIMRTPPKWWPELVTWSEGDIAQSYGAAK